LNISFGIGRDSRIETIVSQQIEIDNIAITYDAIAPVPVPAAVWFFCSGLLGLAGLKKRNS